MTRIRWTTNAANDLAQIVERIREDSPEAATRVAKTIFERIESLQAFPNRGRKWLG